jgi:hypothetical protein
MVISNVKTSLLILLHWLRHLLNIFRGYPTVIVKTYILKDFDTDWMRVWMQN